MRTTVSARALGMVLFSIASGFQKRMKACIEGIALVYRLKAGLKGLAQFLSSRLHYPFPPLA
jgi:hypothetical protein